MLWRKKTNLEPVATEADLKTAYERGRRDERARHKSHPFLAMSVAVVALVGAGMIFLAAREGSFSRGGEVVDLKLASAADSALAAGETTKNAAFNPDDTVATR